MSTRICAVCGTKYSYCPTCEADRHKPTWMMTFHDENCHDIWDTLCAISCNTIEYKEGVDKLRSLDLTQMESFAPNIKKHLNKILGESDETEQVAETKKAVEPEKSAKVERFDKKVQKNKKFML